MGACELSVCALEAPEVAEKRAADHRLRMDVFSGLDNAFANGNLATCFDWDPLKTAEDMFDKDASFEFLPEPAMLVPFVEERRVLNIRKNITRTARELLASE